ncbi:hypothetical protein PkP19E3_25010 [Pseudomonas koreensis]|nr:hypothetical protein PkP19E3_25010 [Pseudomonas koreensis]
MQIPVGASLLAKASVDSISMLPDPALSRAGSLPQGGGAVLHTRSALSSTQMDTAASTARKPASVPRS